MRKMTCSTNIFFLQCSRHDLTGDTSYKGDGRGCRALLEPGKPSGMVCWDIPAIRAMEMGVEPGRPSGRGLLGDTRHTGDGNRCRTLPEPGKP